jgi:hypothetical protein
VNNFGCKGEDAHHIATLKKNKTTHVRDLNVAGAIVIEVIARSSRTFVSLVDVTVVLHE